MVMTKNASAAELSYNIAMNHLISVTKSDGTKQLFEEDKLIVSLRRAGASDDAIEDVTDDIEKEMYDGITTSDIYSRAFALLRKHHHPTAIKYSLRRALLDLGPDGFPFEKFVARIFKLWGYDTLTDQMLLGSCIEHEMDVVAWKGDDLAFVEAKFHNEFGLRSDVKVALYVKARFDDLKDNVFNFGGKERKLSDKNRWLFTNTKFTDQAIKYSECQNIQLVGWNYPEDKSLHMIVEQNGLHPVTCLGSLTHQEKKTIIGLNVLTCIDIIGNPDILRQAGVRPELVEKVLTEAQFIVEQAK